MIYRKTAYKYRAIGKSGSKERERLEEILLERKCYFSKPSKVNDPFDCNPYISYSDMDKLRSKIENKYKKLHPKQKPARGEISRLVEGYKKEVQGFNFQGRIDECCGIFSLSKSPLISLQWSYYGESHKGICLGFDFSMVPKWTAAEVDYTDERTQVDATSFERDDKYRKDTLRQTLFSKSKVWDREEEVRAISLQPGYEYFPDEALTRIVIGLNTPECYKRDLVAMLDKSNLNPEVSVCRQSRESYELTLDKFEIEKYR